MGHARPSLDDASSDALPDYARDLKLNLGSVLTPQGAPGLSESRSASIAGDGDCRAQSQLCARIEAWSRAAARR